MPRICCFRVTIFEILREHSVERTRRLTQFVSEAYCYWVMKDGSSYHSDRVKRCCLNNCVYTVACFFFSKQGKGNLDSNYILYKSLSHKYNWYRFVWRKHFNSILSNTQSPSNIMLYHHVLLYFNYSASQSVRLKSFLIMKICIGNIQKSI